MKARCLNPNEAIYKHYGGRGITVCDKWLTFEGFYEDMGDPPFLKAEIDRIDNNKGYSKENCRWATRTENTRNTRSNRVITARGVSMPVTAWAEKLSTPTSTIYRRLRKGMTEVEAVTTPLDRAATRKLYSEACTLADQIKGGE